MVACVRRLERERLVLTNFVVSEVYTLLLVRVSPRLARQWLRENPLIPEGVTEADEE